MLYIIVPDETHEYWHLTLPAHPPNHLHMTSNNSNSSSNKDDNDNSNISKGNETDIHVYGVLLQDAGIVGASTANEIRTSRVAVIKTNHSFIYCL